MLQPGSRLPRVPPSLRAPAGEEVQVWWARIAPGELAEQARATLAADLDPGTLARIARFHRQQDRDRALAAHALLRRVLAAVVGGRPSGLVLRTRCPACGETAHGKPYLDTGHDPPVQVNLSHSGGVVTLALAPGGVEVGVDVEHRRDVDWLALRRAVFADEEWALTEASSAPDRSRADAWARKEAAVKASGHGLSIPMRSVLITSNALGWTAELPAGVGRALGVDLELGDDVAAALAVHEPAGSLRPASAPIPTVRQVSL